MYRFFCIILLFIIIDAKFLKDDNYFIDFESVGMCDDNDKMHSPFLSTKYVKINRTHKAFSYNLTLNHPLDKNIGATANLYLWRGGDWREMNLFPNIPNLCNFMNKHFNNLWTKYNEALGVEEPNKCPIPAGNYSLRDFIVDTSTISIPSLGGRFKFKMYLMQWDTKIKEMCYLFSGVITGA